MTTRHDFYQTDTHLIVSIYKKGVPADKVCVKAKPNEVDVFVGDELICNLSPLSGVIKPDEITHKVYGTKIELQLPKATGGHWLSLVGAPSGSTVSQSLPQSKPAASTETKDVPKPTSVKKKNWDSLAKEIENDDEPAGTPDDFFKTLYGDLDPDSRRAMLKSYQESNGTVLSTNWEEVGQKYQAPQPPDGMEVRKK